VFVRLCKQQRNLRVVGSVGFPKGFVTINLWHHDSDLGIMRMEQWNGHGKFFRSSG
jgi:hypothetical protein